MADVLSNYVKFLRGTPEAYSKCRKDPDTLYFVSVEGESVGQLWIGDKLITMETTDDGILNYLHELADVDTSGLKQGCVLTWSDAKQKWVVSSIEDAIKISNMIGATASSNGIAGLVPAPKAGEENFFLQGNGKWASIPKVEINEDNFVFNDNNKLTLYGFEAAEPGAQLLKGVDGTLNWVVPSSNTIEGLETTVGLLQEEVERLEKDKADIEYVNTAISNINRLEYKKFDSLETLEQFITENVEIANQYIYLIPRENSEEDDIYDEYMYFEDAIEKMGGFNTGGNNELESRVENLETLLGQVSNTLNTAVGKLEQLESTITTLDDIYLKISTFETTVGSLEALTTKNKNNIVEAINEIDNRTTWGTIE